MSLVEFGTDIVYEKQRTPARRRQVPGLGESQRASDDLALPAGQHFRGVALLALDSDVRSMRPRIGQARFYIAIMLFA